MAAPQTLLQLLQTKTIVDCDTMDYQCPEALGPFVDCTSNQAIALFQLQLTPPDCSMILKAMEILGNSIEGMRADEIAVEIAMVALQLNISKYVTGYVHVQINPYYSYSTTKMVENARRIIKIFTALEQGFDTKRVCIKIPSTWEGLLACSALQKEGITTLATTLFTMEQVAMAGEVGCVYIAPYVNELKVHFEAGFVDNNKAHQICLDAQRYYERHGMKTQVLPASLTSIDEIMLLAGVHHITIAPNFLLLLSHTPADQAPASIFDIGKDVKGGELLRFGEDKAGEEAYRIAFTRSGRGEGERKLSQAINIFCDMQDQLEVMMKGLLA